MGVGIKLYSPVTDVLHGGHWSTYAAARHGSKTNGILKTEDLVHPGIGLGVVATIKIPHMRGIESQSSSPQPATLLTHPKNGVEKQHTY